MLTSNAAFIAGKAEIDAMLARLAALSDEHLKRITDAAFQEGKHQPDSRL